MNDNELEELITRLRNNGVSVRIITETATQQIEDLIKGKSKIPDGCPSIASLTDMILGDVMQNLDEANNTMERLNAYLWNNYNHK